MRTEYITYEEARKNKFQVDWKNSSLTKPKFIGNKYFKDYSIEKIRGFIDWTPFFSTWMLKGKYPEILDDSDQGKEAKKLFDDANRFLDIMVKDPKIIAHAAIGFYPANTVEDDTIILYEDESRTKEKVRLHNLRQQRKKSGSNHSLSDYVAPVKAGEDYIGLFAVSSGIGIEEYIEEHQLDEYETILIKALGDRLAEAFAEHMHHEVRTNFWPYAPDENLSPTELIKEKYQGIRPAHGYPACPDHTEKEILFSLLEIEENLDLKLTESMMMLPASSVSGVYYSHPEAKYFGVGKIQKDQVVDYAAKKKMSLETMEKWLSPVLNY